MVRICEQVEKYKYTDINIKIHKSSNTKGLPRITGDAAGNS